MRRHVARGEKRRHVCALQGLFALSEGLHPRVNAAVFFDLIVEIVHVEQIGQNPEDDLAGFGGKEITGTEFEVLPGDDFSAVGLGENSSLVERIEEHLAVAGNEMSGQVDAVDFHSGPTTDHDVEKGEGDRNADAQIDHIGEE